MPISQPLSGVRVQLSGSIPTDAPPETAAAIQEVVEKLSLAIFRDGGSVVHGSHPSFVEPLRKAAMTFQQAGGPRGALTFVRAHHYSTSEVHQREIEAQREYAAVHIIPTDPADGAKSLVSLRVWMGERADVFVALGGQWNDAYKPGAGVPHELDDALQRGKPAFVLAGFGGAASAYLREAPTVQARLRNGMSEQDIEALAQSTDPDAIAGRIVAQLRRLPFARGKAPDSRMFRILALDGGGLRGAFTAAVLAKWDDMLGTPGAKDALVKNFDLVAGTSTGAILAIGLGMGLSPLEILDFYQKRGPMIFPKDRKLRHWLKSKHDSETLRELLASVFQQKTLSDHSCCRLVIPTVRAVNGDSEVIVTAHARHRTAFKSTTAVDAALASSAAPSYFDEAEILTAITPQTFLDGGIWANNPVLSAIAEAVHHLKVPIDRIDVLSVGTLGHEADFSAALGKGKAGWAPHSVDLFFAAQQHAATEIATALLSPARHLRVNQLTPSPIDLDDVAAMRDMVRRGDQLGAATFAAVRSRFLDGFHAPDWRSEIDGFSQV